MARYHMDAKKFMVGAAVGGIVGSIAALLLAPRSGEKLRQELSEAYDSVADKTQTLAKKVGGYTCDWASKAKTVVDGASRTVKKWISDDDQEQERSSSELLAGTLAGAVVGVVAALLLAPKPGEELRHDLANTYEEVGGRGREMGREMGKRGRVFAKMASDRGNKWLNFAQEVLDDLGENSQGDGNSLLQKAKGLIPNRRAHDVIDLASIGLRLWRDVACKR